MRTSTAASPIGLARRPIITQGAIYRFRFAAIFWANFVIDFLVDFRPMVDRSSHRNIWGDTPFETLNTALNDQVIVCAHHLVSFGRRIQSSAASVSAWLNILNAAAFIGATCCPCRTCEKCPRHGAARACHCLRFVSSPQRSQPLCNLLQIS